MWIDSLVERLSKSMAELFGARTGKNRYTLCVKAPWIQLPSGKLFMPRYRV
jgi:hypothetical protein